MCELGSEQESSLLRKLHTITIIMWAWECRACLQRKASEEMRYVNHSFGDGPQVVSHVRGCI
jgi:hypothetical protein